MISFSLKKYCYLLFLLQFCQVGRIKCEEGERNEISKSRDVEQDKGRITSGVFREFLPSPVFYEMFMPIVYEFSTPKWNKTDLSFNNWFTCISETAPYRYTCPIAFHMNKAILNLHIDFESLTPTEDIGNNSDYFSALYSRSDFCGKIQKHFNSPFIHHDELDKYMENLFACTRATDLNSLININDMRETIQKYNYTVRETFVKMESNFYHMFYRDILNSSNNLTNSTRVASAVLSNSRMALQANVLSFFYAEQSRWSHAKMSCSSQTVPLSLVSRGELYRVLDKIGNMTWFTDNYDMSIDKDFVSKYYSLPLTDCAHTNNSFIIRILLPIVKKFHGKVLELVQLHNPPFFHKNNLCRLNLENGKFFIFNELAGSAFPSNCQPSELCGITEYSMLKSLRDPCAYAILSENNKEILENCDFKCVPIIQDLATIPSYVVHRIASNKYVLTKSSSLYSPFTIQCENIPEKEFPSEKIGAWLVTLPCACNILLPSQNKILHSDWPCTEKLKVQWILPIHFVNETNYHFSENDAATVSDDTENPTGHEIPQLSQLIDENVINSYIPKISGDRVNSEKFKDQQSQFRNDNHAGNILFGIFAVVALVILTMQLYIMYELKRIKQITYPKNDHILYRVPDSPMAEHVL